MSSRCWRKRSRSSSKPLSQLVEPEYRRKRFWLQLCLPPRIEPQRARTESLFLHNTLLGDVARSSIPCAVGGSILVLPDIGYRLKFYSKSIQHEQHPVPIPN